MRGAHFNFILYWIYGLLANNSLGLSPLSPVILKAMTRLHYEPLQSGAVTDRLVWLVTTLLEHSNQRLKTVPVPDKDTEKRRDIVSPYEVPGDGGNQLEARLNKSSSVHYICAKSSDYFTAWLNLELLVPFVMDCWVDYMRLEYDNTTRTTRAPPGVSVRVPGWGLSDTVEWLDPSRASPGAYFSTLATALVARGYTRNHTLNGAPYDFRKAPNEHGEFFTALRALVEQSHARSGGARVTLVAHSMGGNMAAHFLRRQSAEWRARYVRRLVTLATPWAGAVKALKVFAIGDDLGSRVLRAGVLRGEQVTCPSLAWLLPSTALWPKQQVLVQTTRRNYTVCDHGSFLSDLGLPSAASMHADTQPYADDLSAPGVELHCIYGYNISTVERLVYGRGAWLDGTPTLVGGDGDGTVNLRSLDACSRWGARVVPLRGADHLRLLHDQRAIDYLLSVLQQP